MVHIACEMPHLFVFDERKSGIGEVEDRIPGILIRGCTGTESSTKV